MNCINDICIFAVVTNWRGHVESVTAMVMVEEHRMLLTSSLDCTVRVWTTDGEYVGTFGQPEPWDVYNPSTFQHPMVPYDVLIDPMSLPKHPILQDKQNTQQLVHEDSPRCDDMEDKVRAGCGADLNTTCNKSGRGCEVHSNTIYDKVR